MECVSCFSFRTSDAFVEALEQEEGVNNQTRDVHDWQTVNLHVKAITLFACTGRIFLSCWQLFALLLSGAFF